MTKVSSSPQRNTFQDNNPDYHELWANIRKAEAEKIHDPAWQKDNLEYDLRSTEWILEKVRDGNVYAQNLYSAMCNNEFTKKDTWPILSDKRWSCSWRHAGGIIADMQEKGDYIDWYCSGIKGTEELTPDQFHDLTIEQQMFVTEQKSFVPEGTITEEIDTDLHKLGWFVVKSE